MTRVEEATQRIHNRAILEAEKYSNSHCGSIIEEVAYGRGFKAGFIEGYEQVEKDLELTWEDMDRIITASNIVADLHYSKKREMTSWKQYCEEVLKRFKEAKK